MGDPVGSIFCMPFGGNSDAYRYEKHPPHGETAGSTWKHVSTAKQGSINTLTVEMKTAVRLFKVTKQLQLVDGHNVECSRKIGMKGSDAVTVMLCPQELSRVFPKSFSARGVAHAVKPGLFITRSVSEGLARNPSLTLRVMKNTARLDGILQLQALQHFAPVIGNLMNNPG